MFHVHTVICSDPRIVQKGKLTNLGGQEQGWTHQSRGSEGVEVTTLPHEPC